jgi:hypothetical protein
MSIYRDPRCVYVADDMTDADVTCAYLNNQGIAAQVMNQATHGGLVGLGLFSPKGVSLFGMEVWVLEHAQVEEARKLLADRASRVQAKQTQLEELGPVDATCEECGHTSSFPGKHRGTIQECPKCREYIDVPNPGFDWDWESDTAAG